MRIWLPCALMTLVPMGCRALFFLDYGRAKAEAVAEIVMRYRRSCRRKSGCALVGGDGRASRRYDPDDYDLAGFVVGVVDKPKT